MRCGDDGSRCGIERRLVTYFCIKRLEFGVFALQFYWITLLSHECSSKIPSIAVNDIYIFILKCIP